MYVPARVGLMTRATYDSILFNHWQGKEKEGSQSHHSQPYIWSAHPINTTLSQHIRSYLVLTIPSSPSFIFSSSSSHGMIFQVNVNKCVKWPGDEFIDWFMSGHKSSQIVQVLLILNCLPIVTMLLVHYCCSVTSYCCSNDYICETLHISNRLVR